MCTCFDQYKLQTNLKKNLFLTSISRDISIGKFLVHQKQKNGQKISITRSQMANNRSIPKVTPKSQLEIARLCGISLCSVQTTLKSYKLSSDIKDLPRIGRPSKLNSRDQDLLYRRVREDPKISHQELSAEFSNNSGCVSVSYSTARSCLNKKGINCYVAARNRFKGDILQVD